MEVAGDLSAVVAKSFCHALNDELVKFMNDFSTLAKKIMKELGVVLHRRWCIAPQQRFFLFCCQTSEPCDDILATRHITCKIRESMVVIICQEPV